MPLAWFATAPIEFANVRAFSPGHYVPDSIVARFDLDAAGKVEQREITYDPPGYNVALAPLLRGDVDSDEEREALVPSRLSEGALRAAFGREYARPGRVLPGYVSATNCWGSPSQNQGGGLRTSAGTCRSPHRATTGITDLRLAYGAWFLNGTYRDTDPAAAYPISAAVEVDGVVYPVTFQGARVAAIDPGGLVVSDPLGISIPAGTIFHVRTYINSTAWYGNTASRGSSGATGGFTANADLTATGSAAVTNATAWLFSPMAILGTPLADDPPGAVAVVGDSIASGTGDNGALRGAFSGAPGYESGYVLRALTDTPHVVVSHPGDTAENFITDAAHFRRMPLLNGCEFALCEYGVNDLYTLGRPLDTIKASLTKLWTQLAVRGMRVHQTTLTPKTTSTDGWASIENQTPVSAERIATLAALNDWIRSVPAPLTGYFEVADLAMTARNSGIWRAGCTGDGLHPNATGAAALAAGIVTSRFA